MATRSSPITVGREADLARIDRARALAAEGRPVIAIVRGEAGIGKTRFVADAIDRATAAGSPILHGACLDLEGEPLPYLPFVEALRTLVQSTPADHLRAVLGPAGPDLATLVPEIATVDSGRGTSTVVERSIDSSVDRARLFERFLGFLERLGEDQPVLAVLEDVQWIDPATRDLVTFLVRNVTKHRLVAVLTCRTDDLSLSHPVRAWLAELGRAPGAIGIELRRLTQEDVLRQLEAMSEGPVPDELFRSIWRRSEPPALRGGAARGARGSGRHLRSSAVPDRPAPDPSRKSRADDADDRPDPGGRRQADRRTPDRAARWPVAG